MNILRWRREHSLYSHIVAPIWLRIPEKQRWKIVARLDKSRRRCWSDLVNDALAQADGDDACDTHVPALPCSTAPDCATHCYWVGHSGVHDCACYCGKFQFTAVPDTLT